MYLKILMDLLCEEIDDVINRNIIVNMHLSILNIFECDMHCVHLCIFHFPINA